MLHVKMASLLLATQCRDVDVLFKQHRLESSAGIKIFVSTFKCLSVGFCLCRPISGSRDGGTINMGIMKHHEVQASLLPLHQPKTGLQQWPGSRLSSILICLKRCVMPAQFLSVQVSGCACCYLHQPITCHCKCKIDFVSTPDGLSGQASVSYELHLGFQDRTGLHGQVRHMVGTLDTLSATGH